MALQPTPQGVVAGSIPLFAGHPAHELLPISTVRALLDALWSEPDVVRLFNYGDEQGNRQLIDFLAARRQRRSGMIVIQGVAISPTRAPNPMNINDVCATGNSACGARASPIRWPIRAKTIKPTRRQITKALMASFSPCLAQSVSRLMRLQACDDRGCR